MQKIYNSENKDKSNTQYVINTLKTSPGKKVHEDTETEDFQRDPVDYILDKGINKKIVFVYGNEDECEYIFHNMVDQAKNDIKFIPKSWIMKSGWWDNKDSFPYHNIETAKYLVVTKVKEYNDLNWPALKELVGSDEMFCSVSCRIVSPRIHKIIIFLNSESDPLDYFATLEAGALHRLEAIKNGRFVELILYKTLISLLTKIERLGDRDECSYKHIMHGLTALYWRGDWTKMEDYETPGCNSQETIKPYWNEVTKIFNKLGKEEFKRVVIKYSKGDYKCDYRLDLYDPNHK